MRYQTGTRTVEKTVEVEEPVFETPSSIYKGYRENVQERLDEGYEIVDFRPPNVERDYWITAISALNIQKPGGCYNNSENFGKARLIVKPVSKAMTLDEVWE